MGDEEVVSVTAKYNPSGEQFTIEVTKEHFQAFIFEVIPTMRADVETLKNEVKPKGQPSLAQRIAKVEERLGLIQTGILIVAGGGVAATLNFIFNIIYKGI